MSPKEVRHYRTVSGRVPFLEWLYALHDRRVRTIVQNRLERFVEGNPGHWRWVGQGVFELKIYFGPGYRVYFGYDGPYMIILLCGGVKDEQTSDIQAARDYWKDYQRRTFGTER